MALLLTLAKRVVPHHLALAGGDWRMRYTETDSILLHGKTALIVGMGRIGTHVGRMLSAFGMRVRGIRRSDTGAEAFDRLQREVPGLEALDGPDELYCDLMVASEIEGADAVAGMHVCYSGPEHKAEKALAPIYALGTPIVNSVVKRDYVEIQRSWDNTDPRNNAEYLKSGFVNDIPDSLMHSLIEGFEPADGRSVTIYFQHSGGAIGRVAADATAFAQRDSKANMLVFVGWPLQNEAEPHVSYIRRYWDTLAPYTDGYYTVETFDESREVRHGNYQGNFPRLLELKKKYDPTNLFRLNANINPGA